MVNGAFTLQSPHHSKRGEPNPSGHTSTKRSVGGQLASESTSRSRSVRPPADARAKMDEIVSFVQSGSGISTNSKNPVTATFRQRSTEGLSHSEQIALEDSVNGTMAVADTSQAASAGLAMSDLSGDHVNHSATRHLGITLSPPLPGTDQDSDNVSTLRPKIRFAGTASTSQGATSESQLAAATESNASAGMSGHSVRWASPIAEDNDHMVIHDHSLGADGSAASPETTEQPEGAPHESIAPAASQHSGMISSTDELYAAASDPGPGADGGNVFWFGGNSEASQHANDGGSQAQAVEMTPRSAKSLTVAGATPLRNQMATELQSKTIEVFELRARVSELTETRSHLTRQLEETRVALAKAQESTVAHAHKLREAEGVLRQLQRKLEEAESKLSAETAGGKGRERLQRRVGDLEAQLASKTAEAQRAKDDAAALERRLHQLKASSLASPSPSGKRGTMPGTPGSAKKQRADIATANGEIDRLNARVADLSQELAVSKEKAAKAEAAVADAERQRTVLGSELRQRMEGQLRAEAVAADLRAELASLPVNTGVAVASQRDVTDDRESDVRAMSSSHTGSRRENLDGEGTSGSSTLSADVAALIASIDESGDDATKRARSLNGLKAALRRAAEENTELRRQLEVSESRARGLERSILDEADRQVAESPVAPADNGAKTNLNSQSTVVSPDKVTSTSSREQSVFSPQSSRIKELEEKLAVAAWDVERAQTAHAEEVQSLRAQLTTAHASLATSEEKLAKALEAAQQSPPTKKTNNPGSSSQALRVALDSAREALRRSEAESERQRLELERELSQKTGHIERCESRLAQADERCDGLRKRCKEADTKTRAAVAEVDAVRADLARTKGRAEAARAAQADAEASKVEALADVMSARQALQIEVERRREDNTHASNELARVRAECEEAIGALEVQSRENIETIDSLRRKLARARLREQQRHGRGRDGSVNNDEGDYADSDISFDEHTTHPGRSRSPQYGRRAVSADRQQRAGAMPGRRGGPDASPSQPVHGAEADRAWETLPTSTSMNGNSVVDGDASGMVEEPQPLGGKDLDALRRRYRAKLRESRQQTRQQEERAEAAEARLRVARVEVDSKDEVLGRRAAELADAEGKIEALKRQLHDGSSMAHARDHRSGGDHRDSTLDISGIVERPSVIGNNGGGVGGIGGNGASDRVHDDLAHARIRIKELEEQLAELSQTAMNVGGDTRRVAWLEDRLAEAQRALASSSNHPAANVTTNVNATDSDGGVSEYMPAVGDDADDVSIRLRVSQQQLHEAWTQKRRISEQLVHTQDERATAEARANKLQRTVNDLNSKLERSENEITRLREDMDAVNTSHTATRQELSSLRSTADKLEVERAEIARLQTLLDDERNATSSAKEEIRHGTSDLQSAKLEIEKLTKQVEESEALSRTLEAEVAALRQTMGAHDASDCEDAAAKTEVEISHLQQETIEARAQVETVEAEVASAVEIAASAERRAEWLQARLRTAEDQLSEARRDQLRVPALEDEVAWMQESVEASKTMAKELGRVRETLAEREHKIEEMTALLAAGEQRASTLERQLQVSDSLEQNKQHELERTVLYLEERDDQLRTTTEQLAELSKSLVTLQGERKELESSLSQTQALLAASQEREKLLKEQLQTAQAENGELLTRLRDAKEAMSKSEEEALQAMERAMSMEAKLKSEHGQRQAAEAMLEETQLDMQRTKRDLTSALDALKACEDRVRLAEAARSEALEEASSAKESVRRIEGRLSAAMGEGNEAEDRLRDQIAHLEARAPTSEAEVESLLDEAGQLVETLSSVRHEKSEVEAELSRLRNQTTGSLAAIKNQTSMLQNQLDAAKTRALAAENKNEELVADLRDSEERIRELEDNEVKMEAVVTKLRRMQRKVSSSRDGEWRR